MATKQATTEVEGPKAFRASVIHRGYPPVDGKPTITYVGGKNVKAARRTLEREGYTVFEMWVLETK